MDLLPTRRRFLISSAAAGLVLSQWPLFGKDDDPEAGKADSMITPDAQRAIERGLEYLFTSQQGDGSWGEKQYRGNVAITSLCGLAFMAGGHQPGRGNYGKAVERALDFVLSKE
ncbi:MAG TPA: prenyltransferase, partial [Gemmataceae bacterium]|nr:prenyltransferase [Gemmataceae bacterium]